MAIVWPCPLPVDAYVAAGREVEVPAPGLPVVRRAAGVLVWLLASCPGWRAAAGRSSCPGCGAAPCRVSHALLPAFALAWRLDVAETVGAVIGQVAGGACGVRPAAARAGVPYTTARGWVRRFRARAPELGAGFAALAVELGGEAIRPAAEAGRFALAAIGAAFAAAAGLPGWLAAGRVAVRVVGERREADRGQHRLALPGGRQTAFHASCPIGTAMNGGTHGPQGSGTDRVAPLGGDRRGGRAAADRRRSGERWSARSPRAPTRTRTGRPAATRGARSTAGCGPGAGAGWTR